MSDTAHADPAAAIWAARRERARHWRSADLLGYPALSLEHETTESLAATTRARAAILEDYLEGHDEVLCG